HPTDVIEDADGSLLIADTGSWYMICCPTSKIAKPNVLGSIYRIKKKDAPVQDDPAQDDPRGLKLDWSTPQVGWLNDKRPAVVKRAIDQLGTASQIDALLKSDSQVPKVWAIHRIDEPEARRAIRDFLLSESKPVQIAAIHSVALWRDSSAFAPLLRLLSDTDPKIQRVAAMALGRLGQPEAVKPLLDVYHDEMDAFQKHAITYAVYEIAKINHVQPSHPVVRQVRRILKNDQQGLKSVDYPKIQPAKIEAVDPVVLAYQKRRLQELTASLANGDESRGKKLFDDQSKSKCVTCHLSGEVGTRLGPDLTGIGSIRSERDLLEAIIFPDASIVRYHETINVLTKNDDLISGLLVKETDNEMFLSSAEGVIEIVRFADIRTARYSNVSLMPKGFDQIFTPQEIADLVAYLKSNKLE
ncbi:MAG: HEAT repeat domain-containing protein, partial [Rubripirellula sp.]